LMVRLRFFRGRENFAELGRKTPQTLESIINS